MDNQTILIGILILILLIVIIFAIVINSIVSIEKPIEKVKLVIEPIEKIPIYERLIRKVDKIYYSGDVYPNDYLIILNPKSFGELKRFVMSSYQFNYRTDFNKFMEFQIKVAYKLEQDFLILKIKE